MIEVLGVIGVVIVLAVGIVLILAANKPKEFSVQREIKIQAPPDKIFPLISDFHQWLSWSPYEGKDPAMTRSYSGSTAGKGAIYTWDGNNKVGSGRMEILDVSVPSKIIIKLDFLRPFEGHNTAEFTLLPQSDATTDVVWRMYGPAVCISRIMQVVINMDAMIGKDFEAGLANLKRLAEK